MASPIQNGFRATWWWRFFLAQVRRNRLILALARRMWHHGDYLYHVARVCLTVPPRYSLQSLSTLKLKKDQIEVVPGESVVTPIPVVFPAARSGHLVSPHTMYVFPPVYQCTLADAIVTGGTNLIRHDNIVVCHDLYDPDHDETAEELHRRIFVHASNRKISWLMPTAPVVGLPEAAAFTDACSKNYAHWLTEVLPRIFLFCREASHAGTPIIVDAGLHPNLVESLRLVAGNQRRIITLAPSETIQVEKLLLTSVVGYVPFGRRNRADNVHSHGRFSKQGLTALRDHMKTALAERGNPDGRKLYLRRGSGTRNATNRAEIETLLIERGFTVIEPDRMSFAEQVRQFASANMVVGVTGAAFANLIFCSPATRIVILASDYRHLSYWYWQNIACATGNRIGYVIGTCTEWPKHPHSSYKIDIRDLLDAIDE